MEAEGTLSGKRLAIGYDKGRSREKRVHGDLSFSLRPGTLTCLLGPNGAGKSTLLRTLGGSQPPLSGQLLLEGRPFSAFGERERSRLIGLVLTDKTHAGGLRAEEVVALGRYPHLGFFGSLKGRDRRIVREAMERTGIADKADRYAAELSDGERQKVMIAKTLAQECPLILLDEPTAFLDAVSRIEIMNLLHELAGSGKTVLLSTHDVEQALLAADRLWLLSRDRGLREGTPEDLVFAGEMNRFFDRRCVAFDRADGSFRLNRAGARPVLLEAEGELRFWTRRLLARNGFSAEEAVSAPDGLTVRVSAPDRIEILRKGGNVRHASSFEQLAAFLNEN